MAAFCSFLRRLRSILNHSRSVRFAGLWGPAMACRQKWVSGCCWACPATVLNLLLPIKLLLWLEAGVAVGLLLGCPAAVACTSTC